MAMTERAVAERLVNSSDPIVPTGIVSDERTLGGMPVLSGTRIPAATIAAYLRAGHSVAEIRSDYPSLPADGIDAVETWAADEYGTDWKSQDASIGA